MVDALYFTSRFMATIFLVKSVVFISFFFIIILIKLNVVQMISLQQQGKHKVKYKDP